MSTLDPGLPRTCAACGGPLLPRETRTAFFEGERLVVVEGVPGLACRACGLEPSEPTAAVRFGRSVFLDAS